MSILITGMEMPNKKNGAVLIIYPNGDAVFEDGYHYKAIPVPPHGRLIDADALLDEGADLCLWEYDDENTWGFSYDMINDAPTIIPAGEEGE